MVDQNSKKVLKCKSCIFARKAACKMHESKCNISKIHSFLVEIRGLKTSENAAGGRKMPFMDGH